MGREMEIGDGEGEGEGEGGWGVGGMCCWIRLLCYGMALCEMIS